MGQNPARWSEWSPNGRIAGARSRPWGNGCCCLNADSPEAGCCYRSLMEELRKAVAGISSRPATVFEAGSLGFSLDSRVVDRGANAPTD